MKRKSPWLLFAALLMASSFSQALTFEKYIERVKKNKVFQSLELSKEAARSKLVGADIELTPTLTSEISKTTDQSQPSTLGSKREYTLYSLGVTKKFQTGTSLILSAQTNQFQNAGAANPLDQYSTGGLGITLKQSLWKDSFGHGTRLRQERERLVNEAELLGIELKIRQTLLEAEGVFWDFASAQEDLRLRKANAERSKKLEQWTLNRVNNGISDRADLMNVRALASLREFQLATAEDEAKAQEVKFREFMGLSADEATPEVDDDMLADKNMISELRKKNNVVRIDSYLSTLEAKTKKLVSEEVEDRFRPDVSLVGSYGTTAYNRDYNEVTSKLTNTDTPKTYVGVTLSWMFGTEAKSAQKAAAQQDAVASQYAAERNLTLGRLAWEDLLRRYETLKKNVTTLQKVANFQRERAKAEQDKLNKGRSITATVVTAETDAAEAEFNYLKAKSGLRKLEASSLLYIPEMN